VKFGKGKRDEIVFRAKPPMKISIVTDEISADPETAIELGVEWGVKAFELRGVGSVRVPLLDPFQKSRLHELVEEYGIQIIAISPGLFKCAFPLASRQRFPLRTFDQALFQQWQKPRDVLNFHQQELLPASIEFAREFGAGKIVTFGFERGPEPGAHAPEEILAALSQAAEQIGRAGLGMVIEVETGFWVDTGPNAAAVMRAIDHPALGINWDPGNAIVAGDIPYPDGYNAVRDFVRHVHFKDVAFDSDGEYRYSVAGAIDWAGQIRALATDGYDGFISVETHMEPKVRSARIMTGRLQQLVSDNQ
jgi:sugar phosphate isomerase/epimerase